MTEHFDESTSSLSLRGEGGATFRVPVRRASVPVLWDAKSTTSFEDDDDDTNRAEPGDDLATAKAATAARLKWNEVTATDQVDLRLSKVTNRVTDVLNIMLQDIRRRTGTTPTPEQRTQAHTTLSQVPPFSYLPRDPLLALMDDLHVVPYKDGEVIVQQGDDKDRSVYVLESGRIMMVRFRPTAKLGEPAAHFVGYLDAPAYFGSHSILFECQRGSQIVAGGEVTVYRMTGSRFESLLRHHKAFRIKLALGLRSNGIFDDMERFVAICRRAVAHEKQIDFLAVLASYRRMTPSIHANLHSAQLDMEGWTYAIRRLPDSVTSTYVYLLAETVPLPFMHPSFSLRDIYVPTAMRRREAFAVDDGKLLVILRDNFSDVLDFLSLLCAHIHESEKLRTRLTNPSSLDILHRCLWPPERKWSEADPTVMPANIVRRQQAIYITASMEEQEAALQQLPLSPQEMEGLQELWPKDYLYRIWDLIVLHENIQIQNDMNKNNVTATDRWAEQIRLAVAELLQCNEKNPEICIQKSGTTTHIISSNTTSVRNLLSPYILKNKTKIEAWGKRVHPEIMTQTALSESNKLSALCNAYMKSHPSAIAEQDEFDKTCFKTMRYTELTGIQVELIDLNALHKMYQDHHIEPDPYLAPCFAGDVSDQPRLLVNIDYAFGKQAEYIMSALSLLFGESIASVGVMGKAGGLQGKRGDIIVADYLIHQEDDQQTIIDNTGVDREALHTLSQRTVWSGGVLTVLGTLLQDTQLLNFYKKVYGCVSLEMEGSFYARELRRYKKAGLLKDSVNLRFLYYVSDTPLSQDQTETLSKDMDVSESIPAQYAVTRELLRPALARPL